MRERTEQKADDVTGHAKAMKRHYRKADKSTVQSEDSSQSESENTAVGRSQTFVKTNESKANVSALNGETGLEKGQSTITEKDVSDSEGDLENRVEGNGKIIEQGCDKGSDMEVNGIRETDGKTIVAKQEPKKTHTPKRKAANEDNSQFPKNSGNYTCNEQGVKKRKKSKNKDCLNETEQKESGRNSSDEGIADDGVAERNEGNSQFLENSGNHTCNEKGAKRSRKRKNKDFFTEAKEKESDTDSTDVEIADNGVEEKNEDNSQFTEQVQDVDSNVSKQEQQYDSKATSREYLGKGDRRTINSLHNSNKKRLQDSVAVVSEDGEISSSEATVMASSSQKGKIARTNFHLNNKERLEDSDSVVSQQEEISDSEATPTTKSGKNSGNHMCNEKGAKRSRKRKNKDFFTEAKEKESDTDSTDVEIADNGVEEKNEDNSQFPENSRNHVCNEEGAKKSRKSKIKDLLSEAKQKKSDRDSSDRKIADDRVNEKKDKQSQEVERPELYVTENEKKRKKKKKIRKYDSPSPQKESGLRGVAEEKWKMEESVDFGTIKEIKKGAKERSSKPGN